MSTHTHVHALAQNILHTNGITWSMVSLINDHMYIGSPMQHENLSPTKVNEAPKASLVHLLLAESNSLVNGHSWQDFSPYDPSH